MSVSFTTVMAVKEKPGSCPPRRIFDPQMTPMDADRILISMNHTIPAIFDAGVFRPLEPVDLAEGTQVQVQVPRPAEETSRELSPEGLARQQAAIKEMLAEIESLPIEEPDDGFSGRDHDKILYGAP